MTDSAQARALQPIPATVQAAKHMLLCLPGLPHLDNLSLHLNPARLPGLLHLDNLIIWSQLLPALQGLCYPYSFFLPGQFLLFYLGYWYYNYFRQLTLSNTFFLP
jgi:hypothetical protein